MSDHTFDYPPSYQRLSGEIDQLRAENNDLQEEVDCLKEQVAEMCRKHDNKAITNCDMKRQIMTLNQEKGTLEAQVGRLNMQSNLTLHDGLVKLLDDIIQEKLDDHIEDYWSDNE